MKSFDRQPQFKGKGMPRALAAVTVVLVATLFAAADEPAKTPAARQPGDFKLVMHVYGVAKEPVQKAEMVVHNGKVFRFDAEPSLEVVVVDPALKKVELLDLGRKLRTELPYQRLDTFQSNLHGAIATASTKRESQGGKANEVAAAMSRDLIDPRYVEQYDAATRTVRLSNNSLNFEGRGEVENDRARLGLIAETLTTYWKLDSMRNPSAIPPFTKIEALRVMTEDHQLRPTETTFVYRLAGPPRKYRYTYRLEPALTEREVEGISLIEMLRLKYHYERFERYERSERKPAPEAPGKSASK